jgi:hypothetical protein
MRCELTGQEWTATQATAAEQAGGIQQVPEQRRGRPKYVAARHSLREQA